MKTSEKTCQKKVAFFSDTEAKGAAMAITKGGTKMHHYKCEVCEFWHLSSGCQSPPAIAFTIDAESNPEEGEVGWLSKRAFGEAVNLW